MKNVNCRTRIEVINININKEKYERMIKEIKKARRKISSGKICCVFYEVFIKLEIKFTG